jgi:hypothetical protein
MVQSASDDEQMERQMAINHTARSMIFGAALLAATGMASAAHASVLFNNTTDERVVFTFHCAGGTNDRWTLGAGDELSLTCKNGADEAAIRIVTNEGNGERAVVTGTVFDGRAYSIGYDRDGDVSYSRIS